MNTLPTQVPDPGAQPSLSPAIASMTYSSPQNRRVSLYPLQRAYPWLLLASTSVAAICCFMYITKPVFISPISKPSTTSVGSAAAAPTSASLLTSARASEVASPSAKSTPFEETNLRVQHILTAIAPDGQKSRIDIEVPVLYQSRKFRWSASEVASARDLLKRLADYQEKAMSLHQEGRELLTHWNKLVETSIPAGVLRADSPTLPANQRDAEDAPRPADLDTTELIQIQPAQQ